MYYRKYDQPDGDLYICTGDGGCGALVPQLQTDRHKDWHAAFIAVCQVVTDKAVAELQKFAGMVSALQPPPLTGKDDNAHT